MLLIEVTVMVAQAAEGQRAPSMQFWKIAGRLHECSRGRFYWGTCVITWSKDEYTYTCASNTTLELHGKFQSRCRLYKSWANCRIYRECWTNEFAFSINYAMFFLLGLCEHRVSLKSCIQIRHILIDWCFITAFVLEINLRTGAIARPNQKFCNWTNTTSYFAIFVSFKFDRDCHGSFRTVRAWRPNFVQTDLGLVGGGSSSREAHIKFLLSDWWDFNQQKKWGVPELLAIHLNTTPHQTLFCLRVCSSYDSRYLRYSCCVD